MAKLSTFLNLLILATTFVAIVSCSERAAEKDGKTSDADSNKPDYKGHEHTGGNGDNGDNGHNGDVDVEKYVVKQDPFGCGSTVNENQEHFPRSLIKYAVQPVALMLTKVSNVALGAPLAGGASSAGCGQGSSIPGPKGEAPPKVPCEGGNENGKLGPKLPCGN